MGDYRASKVRVLLLTNCIVDIGRSFEAGEGKYVALSRCNGIWTVCPESTYWPCKV